MRSSIANGSMSMLHPKRESLVHEQVRKTALKHGIRLRRYVNVGNHLHLIVQIPSKPAWKAFIRELAGTIAMLMTGARKGCEQKFWNETAFTRIVTWGRDYENLKRYFIKNRFEAAGISVKKAREQGFELVHTCLAVLRPMETAQGQQHSLNQSQ